MLFLQGAIPSQDEITQDMAAKAENAQKVFSSWWHKLLETPRDAMLDLGGWALHAVVLVLAAAAVYFIGRWLIKKLLGMIQRIFERRKVDSSVAIFTLSLVRVVLYMALFIGVVGILGVKTASFITILAAAGFAVGMALSGTLQNFAGGVMILLLKPYRVGDYIIAQGQEGTVKAIQLFNTVMTTSDNRTIYLPNGPVSTGIVMNTSTQNTRRVEWVFGINYGDDFELAGKVIRQILDSNSQILRKPEYTIEIKELAESAVNVVVRVWVRAEDYWAVFFAVNAQVYKILPEKGIRFPYPQMDIHITQ